MLNEFYNSLGGPNSASVIIISIGIMLLGGFLATRITKLLRLPNVTAYILIGICLGPFCLNLMPQTIIDGMEFIPDVALAFIAFGVGENFRFEKLKRNGKRVIVITLFEALMATLLVFILSYFILGLGLGFSAVLAALASATAPASTMMTIRQLKAKGEFVDTLLSVVALDDVVSLVAYSVAISLAMATAGSGVNAMAVILPVLYNIAVIAVGAVMGYVLKFLMQKRSTDNRLIVSVAFLFALCAVSACLGVSPLLACMVMGTVYINVSGDEKLFKQLNYFSPPILLLFFVRSGLNFNIGALFSQNHLYGGVSLLLVGVLYFFVRIVGKYSGAYVGALVTKSSKETRNYLGLALVPQAGVAIGLAALGARLLGGETGEMLETIILSSSILYELVGPVLAKLSLYLSKSYDITGSDELKANPVVADGKPITGETAVNSAVQTAENKTTGIMPSGARETETHAIAAQKYETQKTQTRKENLQKATVAASLSDLSAKSLAEQNSIEELKQKLNDIQKELDKKEYARSDEESAFLDVAMETGMDDENVTSEYMRRKFINRR